MLSFIYMSIGRRGQLGTIDFPAFEAGVIAIKNCIGSRSAGTRASSPWDHGQAPTRPPQGTLRGWLCHEGIVMNGPSDAFAEFSQRTESCSGHYELDVFPFLEPLVVGGERSPCLLVGFFQLGGFFYV